MKTTFKTLALLFMTILVSCSKDGDTAKKERVVYVAGFQFSENSIPIATLWENDKPIKLTDGTKNAGALSVYAANNTTYVVGYESNGSNNIAKIWTNGIAKNLSDGTKNVEARSVFVSGNDVYVAGTETDISNGNMKAKLWKNNSEVSFMIGTTNSSAASVFVAGNDVYVGGSMIDRNTNKEIPIVWKNNDMPIKLDLIPGSNYDSGKVESIYKYGNDLYAAGSLDNGSDTFAYWKNNGLIGIPVCDCGRGSAPKNSLRGSSDSRARSIFANAKGFYTAGNGYGKSLLFTNQVEKQLSNLPNFAAAYGVFATENDVYVVGFESDAGSRKARIWQNTIGKYLTMSTGLSTTSQAEAVFVAN
jgi:hypothetical protein